MGRRGRSLLATVQCEPETWVRTHLGRVLELLSFPCVLVFCCYSCRDAHKTLSKEEAAPVPGLGMACPGRVCGRSEVERNVQHSTAVTVVKRWESVGFVKPKGGNTRFEV